MARKELPNLIKLINDANVGDISGFTKELHEGSDRSSAIMGGVILDEYLKMLLESFLVDSSDVRQLFNVDKPLASFSARNKMAYGLGLISGRVYSDIENIRAIRNAFAHTVHGLTFEHERIKELCSKIEAIRLIVLDNWEMEYRLRFTSAVLILVLYIQAKTAKFKADRRADPKDHIQIGWDTSALPPEGIRIQSGLIINPVPPETLDPPAS